MQKITVQGVSDYYSITFGVPASISSISNQKKEDEEIDKILATESKEELKPLLQEPRRQSSPSSSSPASSSQVPASQNLFQDSQDPYEDYF